MDHDFSFSIYLKDPFQIWSDGWQIVDTYLPVHASQLVRRTWTYPPADTLPFWIPISRQRLPVSCGWSGSYAGDLVAAGRRYAKWCRLKRECTTWPWQWCFHCGKGEGQWLSSQDGVVMFLQLIGWFLPLFGINMTDIIMCWYRWPPLFSCLPCRLFHGAAGRQGSAPRIWVLNLKFARQWRRWRTPCGPRWLIPKGLPFGSDG